MTHRINPAWLPPQTPMEVFEMLPEGTRAELIENAIYMPPAPSIEHQRTSMSLSGELYYQVNKSGKGEIFAAPVDVYLDEKQNAVQPDLVVILAGNVERLTADKRRITGVPDIIIEILSESNKDYDLEKKRALYERFGVKEYFVIDPETGLTFHFYLQGNGRYELARQHIRKLESSLLAHTFSW
jgi:Uma2 family endonuclease